MFLSARGEALAQAVRQRPRFSRVADVNTHSAAFHSDEPMWQGMALGQGLAALEDRFFGACL